MLIIDFFKAIFLGIIEGLTEFIPVSSTAHLILFKKFIDFKFAENGLFEVSIQIGAIFAILVIYRYKIFDILKNHKQEKNFKLASNVVLAFLPSAIFGLIAYSSIKNLFQSNLTIAIALIFGGVLIIVAEKFCKKFQFNEIENINYKTAICIGLFQCLALIPGVSRSGATIIGAMFLGASRKAATEFSFFLAIPTIASASLYDLIKNYENLTYENSILILIGMISSFVTSLLVIKWLIGFVSKNNFTLFAIYRIIFGAIIIFLL